MMKYFFVLFVFFIIFLNEQIFVSSAGCHSTVPSYGPQNNFPLNIGENVMTLKKQVQNGKLYEVPVPNSGGNTSTFFYLTHLYGTPYQMGFAQGSLLADVAPSFVSDVWKYFEEQIDEVLPYFPKWLSDMIADVGLIAALDFTEYMTRSYTGDHFYQEIQGICDAAKVDYNTLVRIHMIAGLTQGKCSMFGMNKEALDPSSDIGMMQLRALDWDMDGPFRNFPAVTVYHPNSDNGHAFVNVGMVGFVGGLTGMSQKQLGISEIGVYFSDASFGDESRIGVPFIFLLRDILQFDLTVDDATTRMANSKRTCDLILGVGDGKRNEFRAYEYSASVLNIFDDKNMQPLNETWHPRIPGVVYYGMDWICPSYNLVLSEQIKKNYGKITPQVAIKDITSVELSGDNHIAFYDLTNMKIYVSFAAQKTVGGNPAAYARQFTSFDVNKLFAVPSPQM